MYRYFTFITGIVLYFAVTESEKLKASLYGIVGGVSYPYPLPNSNACETEDIDCPLQSGKTYNFENTFEVRQSYPRVSTVYRFSYPVLFVCLFYGNILYLQFTCHITPPILENPVYQNNLRLHFHVLLSNTWYKANIDRSSLRSFY